MKRKNGKVEAIDNSFIIFTLCFFLLNMILLIFNTIIFLRVEEFYRALHYLDALFSINIILSLCYFIKYYKDKIIKLFVVTFLIFIIVFVSIIKIFAFITFADKFFGNIVGYKGEISLSEVEYLKYLYNLNYYRIIRYDLEPNILSNKQYWDLVFVGSTFVISDPYTMFMSNRVALSNVMMPQIVFILDYEYNNETLLLFSELKEYIKTANFRMIKNLVEKYLLDRNLKNRVSEIYLVISLRTIIWLSTDEHFVSIDNFKHYDTLRIGAMAKSLMKEINQYLTMEICFSENWGDCEYFVTIFKFTL
ncbi:MAG: hypothetical protein QXS74_08235 [Nitrososphaeria archaeon]